MSFLAPLFVAGILTVSLPVLFHLIRRAPRGRVEFSSLMFLSPSPPRITKRSRIDNWLLLVLRGLILCLLALAFARPFWRESADASSEGLGKRIVFLLDVSASMRREGLFDLARRRIEERVAKVTPRDRIAVFTFDDRPRSILDFGDLDEAPAAQRASLVKSRLAEVEPTWGSTNLGAALLHVADVLDSLDSSARGSLLGAGDEATESTGTIDDRRSAELEVVLVSDLASGSRLDALANYEWPSDVTVTVDRVRAESPTNAGLTILESDPDDEARADASSGGQNRETVRVLVANDELSEADTFQLAWANANGPLGGVAESTLQVPAGERRVLSVPVPTLSDPVGATITPDRLVLRGDRSEFDNTRFHAAPVAEDVSVLYVGDDDPADANGLRFYAQIALSSDPLRRVTFVTHDTDSPMPASDDDRMELVLVTDSISPTLEASLARHARKGGTVLIVLREERSSEFAGRLLGLSSFDVRDLRPDDYAMLVDLDFSHPLFAPFQDPRFADFTKMRFWRHRQLTLGAFDASKVRILARFDSGSPALLERATGRGRVLVLASGWHPRDSQLALSTKFVPLISRVLELRRGVLRRRSSFEVAEPVPLPLRGASEPGSSRPVEAGDSGDAEASGGVPTREARPDSVTTLVRPDGAESTVSPGLRSLEDTDLPGIYELRTGSRSWRFAVNVAASETATAPLEVEALEARGVMLDRIEEAPERREQKLALELEQSQKLWKWLLAAALGLAIVETWVAGRLTRRVEANEVTV